MPNIGQRAELLDQFQNLTLLVQPCLVRVAKQALHSWLIRNRTGRQVLTACSKLSDLRLDRPPREAYSIWKLMSCRSAEPQA